MQISKLIIAAALAIGIMGCTSASQRSKDIRNRIHDETAEILTHVSSAEADISLADDKILVATTQPTNPPATVTLLTGAHGDLKNAQSDLSRIPIATAIIDTKATEAAAVTENVEKKLKAERAHFWSYKQRWIFGLVLLLAPIAGILIFILKTNGAGPIVAALGSIAMPVARIAWGAIKFVGAILYHLFTLGLAKFADLVNHHYDAQQAAKAEAPPVAEDIDERRAAA